MRRLVLTAALTLAANLPVFAQSDERDVMAVVQQLFDGMRGKDTAKMRAALHHDARLVSAGTRNGAAIVQVESPDAWIEGVGRAVDEPLDEQLRNPSVKIDGGLASVWAEYTLYVGQRRSHCGVDAFHLVRTANGWKVIDVADTRRVEGCPP